MGVETVAIAAIAGQAGLGVASNIAGGIAADRAARRTAEGLEFDASLVERQSEFEAKKTRQAGEQVIARGIAIRGASGVKVNRGSALRTQSVDASEIETSVSNIIFSGKVASFRFRTQAANVRAEGKAAKIAGFLGATQSILGAVSGIAGVSGNADLISKIQAQPVANNVAASVVPRVPSG